MARPEKIALVDEFKGHLERAQGVYVADYQGLNVEQVTELRAAMRAENVMMRVAKNTLVKRAMKESGFDELGDLLVGPNAFVFGFDDPVVPARIMQEFKKKGRLKKPEVVGFVLDGTFMTGDRFAEVADLPGKSDLVAMVVGSIQAPLSGLVYTCNGILRELVGTLDALADQKKAAA